MPDHELRPEAARQRCGMYRTPGNDEPAWGDHRVTLPGTTCEQVACTVAHHPTILPGWAEPWPDYHNRPGARPIAAAFWGWDAAGMHRSRMGDSTAFVAAHVALDALRDAGFVITAPTSGPYAGNARTATAPDGKLSLEDALDLLAGYVATDSRDWAETAGDALLWAVLCGWGCEEDHEHDDDMCSVGAFEQIAERYRWSPEWVETVRQMRRAVLRRAGDGER